jgi:hypothetical protein
MIFQMLLHGVRGVERWIVCIPSSADVFVTLATQQHLEYHCKALFETSGSHIELYLSQVKLGMF